MAVGLHTGLVIGWTTDFLGHGPGILVFNAMVVAVVAMVMRPETMTLYQTAQNQLMRRSA